MRGVNLNSPVDPAKSALHLASLQIESRYRFAKRVQAMGLESTLLTKPDFESHREFHKHLG